VVTELGDGMMLWFSDAQAAVDTCLSMLSRFDAHSMSTLQPLWVRIGLHWGRQTRRRNDLIGHDVNLAARILDQAGPSELLLSEDTIAQLEPGNYQLDEIGPVVMKGIPDPVRLFRAVSI